MPRESATLNSQTVKSLDDFYRLLTEIGKDSRNLHFRGVHRSDLPLVPKVGRLKQRNTGKPLTVEDEKLILKIFRSRAHPYLEGDLTDIELLVIGQHHGLPTRLMDWTKNALAAIYFSVEKPLVDNEMDEAATSDDREEREYSAVYVIAPPDLVPINQQIKPFDIKKVERYIPKHLDKRITAQEGLFTVHNEPNRPYCPSGLIKIRFHRDIRSQVKEQLHRLGVNRASIFPDLDNLCTHIEWLRSESH